MKKTPPDVLRIIEELPQSLLDEIQMTMVIWSGLEFIKMGPQQPSGKTLSQFMDRSNDKFVELMRDAKRRHDQDTGDKSCQL